MSSPFDTEPQSTNYEPNSFGETFRFQYHNSLVFFTEDDISMFGIFSRVWTLAVLGLYAVGLVVPSLTLLIQSGQIRLLASILFVIALAADPVLRGVNRIRSKRLSRLSDAELIQKLSSNKATHLPWSEISSLNLDKGSLTVKWGQGIIKRSMILKYDKSKFDQLQTFLSAKLEDRFAAIKDLNLMVQEQNYQSFGLTQKESFQLKLERFAYLGLLSAAGFLSAGYLLMMFLSYIGRFPVPYGAKFDYPSYLPDALYLTTAAACALSVFSLINLSSSVKELRELDRVRFARFSRSVNMQLVLFVIIGAFLVVYEYFIPFSMIDPVGAPSMIQNIVSVSDWVSTFWMLVDFLLVPIAVISLVVVAILLAWKIGPLYNRGMVIITALLISGTLIFLAGVPWISVIAPNVASVGGTNTPPNFIVNITTVNLVISYPNNSTYGWLGASNQPATGGGDTLYGGESLRLTTTFRPNNMNPDTITSIVVLTPGFTLVSTTPRTPITIDDLLSFNFTEVIQAPYHNYTGPLELDIVVAHV